MTLARAVARLDAWQKRPSPLEMWQLKKAGRVRNPVPGQWEVVPEKT